MYNKLFYRLLDSSIWLEPAATRIVWITLLAAMDQDGFAHFAALDNLAARARVTLAEAQSAVDCFLAPDPNSSNPDNEGRRIERVPGGFLILNAATAKSTYNRMVEREQTRVRVAKHRAKQGNVTKSVTESLQALPNPPSASASASATTETEVQSARGTDAALPTWEEVKSEGSMRNITEPVARAFFDHHQDNNLWRNRFDRLIDWRSKIRTWATNDAAKPKTPAAGQNGHQSPNGAQTVILGKEYDRIVEEMRTLKGTYGDHQTWTASDIIRFNKLKARKLELKPILGITV